MKTRDVNPKFKYSKISNKYTTISFKSFGFKKLKEIKIEIKKSKLFPFKLNERKSFKFLFFEL